MGDGLATPGAWNPSGASDPPRAFDPSGISIPPPTGGITSSSSMSMSSQCALSPPPSISETEVSGESGGGTPAFSASRWFLAEISRRCAFLAAFAFLSSLAFFCSSLQARFLAGSPCPQG